MDSAQNTYLAPDQTRSPIAQISDELLVEILQWFVIDMDTVEMLWRTRGPYPFLVRLMTVCRRWKGVIEGATSLWGTLVQWVDDNATMREVISRVKQADIYALTIYHKEKYTSNVDEARAADAVLMSELLQWIPRARRFRLLISNPVQELVTFQDGPLIAPHLQSIDIEGVPTGTSEVKFSPLYNGVFPRLASLTVGPNIPQYWAQLLFHETLTRLEIYRKEDEAEYSVPFLLIILQRLPLLQEFKFEDGTGSGITDDLLDESYLAQLPKVALSNLRNIYLDDPVERCAALLSQLTFPDDSEVHLLYRTSAEPSCRQAVSSVLKTLQGLGVVPHGTMTDLKLEVDELEFTVTCRTIKPTQSSTRLWSNCSGPSPCLCLKIYETDLDVFFSYHPVNKVQRLDVANWSIYHDGDRDVFGQYLTPSMKALKKITIVASWKQTEYLLLLLRKVSPLYRKKRTSLSRIKTARAINLEFPVLRELDISGLMLEERTEDETTKRFVALMCRALHTRRRTQPVKKLTLRSFKWMSSYDVDLLRDYVPDLQLIDCIMFEQRY